MTYNAYINGNKQPVILIVCPPSHDQQGRKFAATMEALEGWDVQRLYLADTLDRHNRTEIEAFNNGTAWLERHAEFIGNVPVTRWDAIKEKHAFLPTYKEVKRLYKNHPLAFREVQQICRPHAKLVFDRLKAKGVFADPKEILDRSVNYMLEEIAGLALIRQETDSPEVYPGAYFEDDCTFDRFSAINLKLPRVLPISFEKRQIAA